MSQIHFAGAEYAGKREKTRRQVFLEEMELVVPWKVLLKLIEQHYPVTGRGRRPYALESMLCVHLMQNWFALSAPTMEEALYEIASLRSFVHLSLNEPIPDETTILNFRHLLEANDLAEGILKAVNALLARKAGALAHAVRRSCEIKAWVVGQDEREAGLRAILNFGHTFGHAIESGLGYGQWLHGEAVGCGMVMALQLSQRLGLVDPAFVARVTALIARAGLPITGPKLGAERYLELMRVDKKAEAGEIRFVLIDGRGKASLRAAPDALVREVLAHCCP